ncbi:MAG TPA: DUF4142 domain-containing protein [Pseudomonas sp.]|nr:DUF4142 domain-containing protein [Pseudomonas sp.]
MKHSWLPIAGLSLMLAGAPAWAELSPQDFVDKASAAGMAEIEAARMALEDGTSSEVKNFAEKMIKDHTAANEDLKDIATKKRLETNDAPDAMNKAKAMILELREGENFDHAYARNQVNAHEQVIELYREASNDLKDEELKAYAKKKLPTLEEHLKMARQLPGAQE